jgi:hypothetical protein
MSLQQAFSANLSRLCGREKSIAAVCRATRINRQQFNRYLSGQALPNQKNREKICRYFRIDEQDLFREAGVADARSGPGAEEYWSHADFRAALKLVHSEGPTSLTPGLYFAHFAMPYDPASIMRSTIVVRNDGTLSTFRRLTGLSEPRLSWWGNFDGDHRGLILERRHVLYLVGLNARGNREPTLIVLRWLPNSRPMLGGHAAILTPQGPTITAVVVNPCRGNVTLRTAIRASHVFSADDPEIDQMVLDALDQQCQALIAQTRRLDLSVRPLHDEKVREPEVQ